MIGLGRMGGNMVHRLVAKGHRCVVYDRSAAAVAALSKSGQNIAGAASLEDLVKQLETPKTIWVMVPCGEPTETTVTQLAQLLPAGSAIIDGGNSFYKDDVRRSQMLRPKGINYLDAGTSGGVWGVERGYCLMIGGDKAAVTRLDPIFAALAPGVGDIPPTPERDPKRGTSTQGYLYCGPSGAGHFVKMVHNGIEYGIMQAYAEGFQIMRSVNAQEIPEERRYDLNLADIAEVWRRGSVISSWLLDLTASALVKDGELSGYTGYVEDSGEGRWTVEAAIEEAVPAEVLTASLYARFRSRQEHTFAEKILSAMRQQFGGHIEQHAPPP
jgi:6-phosphogluconate dehydrogenase